MESKESSRKSELGYLTTIRAGRGRRSEIVASGAGADSGNHAVNGKLWCHCTERIAGGIIPWGDAMADIGGAWSEFCRSGKKAWLVGAWLDWAWETRFNENGGLERLPLAFLIRPRSKLRMADHPPKFVGP